MRDDYASHLPILALAVHNTEGPIVEIGAGFYSTPMLWGFRKAKNKRAFHSFDQNKDWAKELELFGTQHCQSLLKLPPFDCGLLFVDGPYASKDRGAIVSKWKDFADVIVCHDTQPSVAQSRYAYDFAAFPYQYTYKYTPVWTTILSKRELPWAANLLASTT